MRTSEQINDIAAAAAKAQAELRPAAKDALNPAFRSHYSDEAAIREASRTYAKHGIAIFQEPTLAERGVAVVTLFAHASGQWIEFGPLTIPMSKQDAHGVGSATTYAKRYALQAAAGISSDDDDDGNAASGRDGHTPAVQPKPSKPTRVQPPPQPAPVATTPAGFDEWLADLEAVADEGGERLFATWNASKPEHRTYLTKTNLQKWEAIKAKSVGAAQSHPPPRPTPSPSPKRTTRGEPANG